MNGYLILIGAVIVICILLNRSSKWVGKALSEITLPKGTLIVLIQREGNTLIPSGSHCLWQETA